MANKKIVDLTTRVPTSADWTIFYNEATNKTYKASASELIGPAGDGIVWQGAYSGGTAYAVNDAVSYLGSSYICILASTGNLPTNATYWNTLASKGEDGVSGGDVSKVGTPINNQIGVWTGDGTIEGDADLTFDTTTNTLNVAPVGLDGRVVTHAVKADGSDGLLVEASNGTDAALFGVANTANSTFYGNVSMNTTGKVVNMADPSSPQDAATKAYVDSTYDDATSAETNTGTSTTKYVSPDGLAGSYAGTKSVSIEVIGGATDVTTGDGKAYITIPEALNGMNLVRAQATVVTAGTTNATTVMIHNKTDTQDMLSGAISIASAGTVGTVGTINGSFDDVATNDVLRIDVDSVSTTAPKGLTVILEFRLP